MGRKVSMNIGINYPNTDMQLNGCINDSGTMVQMAIDLGINKKYIYMFVDSKNRKYFSEKYYGNIKDVIGKSKYPSKKNIIDRLKYILRDENVSVLMLTCACHGTQYDNKNDDVEEDNKDDAFCFVDNNGKYSKNTCMIDDEFRKIMNMYTKKRKNPIYIFCLIDICHSGTLLDFENEQHIRIDGNEMIMVNRKINRKIQSFENPNCHVCCIGTGQEIQSVLEDYGNKEDKKKNITRGRGTYSFCKAIDKLGKKDISMTEILQQMIYELDKIDGSQIANTNENSQLPVLSSSHEFKEKTDNKVQSVRFLVGEETPDAYLQSGNLEMTVATKCKIVSDDEFFGRQNSNTDNSNTDNNDTENSIDNKTKIVNINNNITDSKILGKNILKGLLQL